MTLPSLFIRLSFATGLSTLALALCILLQGKFLFPEHVEMLQRPVRTTIHRLSLSRDGSSASVLLKHDDRAGADPLRTTVGIWSFADRGCLLRKMHLEFSAFSAVGDRMGRYLFASTNEGHLYAFDLDSQSPAARFLGFHGEGSVHDLDCTDDGSILIARSRRLTTAWRPDAQGRLWQRDDLDITCACFLGQTTRLFCGVVNGDDCELDGRTGATVRTFTIALGFSVSMDVSPDGKLMAILNHDGAFLVIDLATDRPLWGRKFPHAAAGPRFSPDGLRLITPSETRTPTLLVLSPATGELMGNLEGAKAQVAGIAWSENGVVFAWDVSGTITSWNVVSRSLVRRFSVECLIANDGSS